MPGAVNNGAPGGRVSGTKLGDPEKAQKECTELEAELMETQAAYEQYFLGQERRPPTEKHKALKKRLNGLRGSFVNSTQVKFRVQNLQQRFSTFERLWERSLLEIENGTYRRDLYKAKKHIEERKKKKTARPDDALDDLHIDEDLDLSDLDTGPDEDLDSALAAATAAVSQPKAPAVPTIAPLVPQVAPPPPKGPPSITAPLPVTGSHAALKPPGSTGSTPALQRPAGSTGSTPALQPGPRPPGATGSTPALRPPGATGSNPAFKPGPPAPPAKPVASDGGLNEQKIRAIYDAYVMAKKRCGEDTSRLSLDSVASTLKAQVPTLMKQHNAKSVEFKVVIKDGKAVLRALPKE